MPQWWVLGVQMAYLAGLSLHAGIRGELEREGGRGRWKRPGEACVGLCCMYPQAQDNTKAHRFFLGFSAVPDEMQGD